MAERCCVATSVIIWLRISIGRVDIDDTGMGRCDMASFMATGVDLRIWYMAEKISCYEIYEYRGGARAKESFQKYNIGRDGMKMGRSDFFEWLESGLDGNCEMPPSQWVPLENARRG